jgi:5-(carboxyamino)imidazole ribonucleotide synthase
MTSPVSPTPIAPGATVGIIGGGQLGRMLALAAARLGLKAHIYCESSSEPALDVVQQATIAPFDDESALTLFADSVDVVTYEFENVPAATARFVAEHRPLYPDADVLETTQDRLLEKTALRGFGVPIALFAPVTDRASLATGIGAVGRPAVLKTRRFGYDGKGQVMVREGLGLDAALGMFGGNPSAVLEAFVPFRIEVSVVAARGRDGGFAAYEVAENRHANHILRSSHVPASITPELAAQAVELARRIADGFGYVGVLAVEMFVVPTDTGEHILVNEIAPRVHNSGHWTIDGAATSQFEQHIRAICGWPLGSTERLGRIEMTNLLGDEADRWRAVLTEPGARLHLYGKAEARPGRKMGHVTQVWPKG